MDEQPEQPRKPAEVWAAEQQTPPWLFAAARAHEGWPEGRELTEAAFREALERVAAVRLGY